MISAGIPWLSICLNDKLNPDLLVNVCLSAFTELTVMKKIKKNKLSKAIYLMQKALLLFEKDTVCETSWNLLTVTLFLFDLFA